MPPAAPRRRRRRRRRPRAGPSLGPGPRPRAGPSSRARARARVRVRVHVRARVPFLLVLLLRHSCLFPASLLPRLPSARRPVCRCAFSRMGVTKVSFNWCQRWKEHPAHPARSKFVPRSNLCGGEVHFALVFVDKAAE